MWKLSARRNYAAFFCLFKSNFCVLVGRSDRHSPPPRRSGRSGRDESRRRDERSSRDYRGRDDDRKERERFVINNIFILKYTFELPNNLLKQQITLILWFDVRNHDLKVYVI